MRATLLALVLAGCAANTPRPSAANELDGSAVAAWARQDERPLESVRVRPGDPRAPSAPVRIARERGLPVHRGRTIDVRFERAPLANALRLLAEVGDVGIVIGEGVEGTVSADLRRVRPLLAMQVLAEAHGVSLDVIGETVIARRR